MARQPRIGDEPHRGCEASHRLMREIIRAMRDIALKEKVRPIRPILQIMRQLMNDDISGLIQNGGWKFRMRKAHMVRLLLIEQHRRHAH